MNRRTARLLAVLCVVLAGGAWALVVFATSPRYASGSALTFILLFSSLLLPVLTCFLRPEAGAGIDICQPGTVVALFYYFYMVVPSLHIWYDLGYHSSWIDPTWPPERLFHVTCALGLLGLVGFGAGYHARLRLPHGRHIEGLIPRGNLEWPPAASVIVGVMLVVGLAFKLNHLAAFGGLSPDLLLYLSPTFAIESGVKIGSIPYFLESLFDWGALLLLFRSVTTGKHKVPSLVLTGLALVLAYLLSGKRSAVVPFLLFPAVWYHYVRRRINFGRGLVYLAGLLASTTLLLFARTLGPLLATGARSFTGDAADIVLQPMRFYLNSPELTVFDMTTLAVQDRGFILHSIGGPFWGGLQHNVTPLTYIIPRVLWPTKPVFIDLGGLFYQRAVGGLQEVGFSVGVVGGLYVFGGAIGVALGMTMLGVLFRWVYEVLQPANGRPWPALFYSVFIWMAFMLLRFGTLGSTMIFFIQLELTGILAALVIARTGRRRRAAIPEAGRPA